MVMRFCESNQSLSSPWVERGFSLCFYDTSGSAFLLGIALVLGSSQLVMYWRHGSAINRSLKPKSAWYFIQVVCVALQIFLPLMELSALLTVSQQPFFGHQLLRCVSQAVVWLFVLLLILVERELQLPSPPSRGHGFVLLLFCMADFVWLLLAIVSYRSPFWWFRLRNESDDVKLGLFCCHLLLSLLTLIFAVYAPGLPSARARAEFEYGRLEEEGERDTSSGSTFRNVWVKVRTLLPYLWPHNQLGLQVRVLLCISLLVAGRVINLFVPVYYKYIANSLTPTPQQPKLTFRWDFILVFVALRFCQGGIAGGGLLNICRDFLWIRVQQYTTREVEARLYSHLHSLSLRWHLGRKTGEVLRVMDRGTNSINQLLGYMLFQIAPTVVDIFIAIAYFSSAFNAWFGIIVTVTMVFYLSVTIGITEWRTKFRREMNRLDNEANAKGVDSLLNFETVKYYSAEDYEVNRYKEAILRYQEAEWRSSASLSFLNFLQNCVSMCGLLAGSLLCAKMVVDGMHDFNVGDYVLFATYIGQLLQPLNWLGTYYRQIQTAFIDMENMFDLIKIEPEVQDVPNAPEFKLGNGEINFDNVSFFYRPEKPVLQNVSFSVKPGQTVALVGPSGGGKSTLIRLLFRFYDVVEGRILIDGQNIASVSQKSLRAAIGVVPQDTVLFNDSIRYNIRYGRTTADDNQVEEAARAADIHHKILTFPDAYETVVGERGLKLSGGEKQRVAIARTILKAPAFVFLDEATSALDTQTERNIQASLNSICAERTTVMVAHRLSTIIHADEILVLFDGRIVERGRHDELLARGGQYEKMWMQQIQNVTDASTADTSLQV